MFPSVFLSLLSCLLVHLLPTAHAANADEWRSRSIYQIIVDRYALPSGANLTACNTADQTWCGGTWNTIRDNLDYIQDQGFTAIWISPVSENYVGPRTPYGDPYHGYWIADVSKLNDKFGTADDLKALSDEVHRRGMYLMVDVVVNDVMSLSENFTNPDLSTYFFKEESQYHPYCPIDFSNDTSVQHCWLGDTVVPLADLKTEDPAVQSGYNNWIKELVQNYSIDGLRIDAAKHVNTDFWPSFCGAAGVFCIGEVFDADPAQASIYQGNQSLDSILHYPMYNALVDAFTIPGALNMSAMTDMIAQCKQLFPDPTVLGNFLENQDVPRWGNLSVDPQSTYNAMVFNFMSDGIPIVYYGQEQGFHGASDPFNREPLWPSGYAKSAGYNLTVTLNTLRNFLVNSTDFATSQMQVVGANDVALAISKGNTFTVVTNVGSPPANSSIPLYTNLPSSTILVEVLSCTQYTVGGGGALLVDYGKGGHASVFMKYEDLSGSGLCGFAANVQTPAGSLASSPAMVVRPSLSIFSVSVISVLMGLVMFS